ncbi:MAG: YggS family pyridoxal phosphate-dependent enzyme [Cyanobacteria bacterium P01_A01_bin.123]
MSAFATDQIAERISNIRQGLPDSVRLIAVTKKFPSDVIRVAYEAGVRDFGESQVQEAIAKQFELQDLTDITWHLIGHLQRNKARRALEHFQWIHSVDSLSLAQRLNHLAQQIPVRPQCCLQVKVVPDLPKYGFTLEQLWSALPDLNQLQQLEWAGIMTIPPMGLDQAQTQAVFEQTQQLATTINQQGFQNIQIRELSLGMSSDYPFAIAAGSTMIRLGTVLFGQRSS